MHKLFLGLTANKYVYSFLSLFKYEGFSTNSPSYRAGLPKLNDLENFESTDLYCYNKPMNAFN